MQQRPLEPAPYEQPQPQPRQRVAMHGDKAAAFQQHQQRQQQQQQQNLPNHFNHVSPGEQGGFSLAQRQHQALQQQAVFEHPGQQRGGGGGGGFMDQSLAGSAGQPMASKAASRDVFDGPPPQQAQYGTGMRPVGGGSGGTGMGVGDGMGMGSSSGGVSGLGPGGGQQSGRSPSKRRQPMSMAASDVREFHSHHTLYMYIYVVQSSQLEICNCLRQVCCLLAVVILIQHCGSFLSKINFLPLSLGPKNMYQ